MQPGDVRDEVKEEVESLPASLCELANGGARASGAVDEDPGTAGCGCSTGSAAKVVGMDVLDGVGYSLCHVDCALAFEGLATATGACSLDTRPPCQALARRASCQDVRTEVAERPAEVLDCMEAIELGSPRNRSVYSQKRGCRQVSAPAEISHGMVRDVAKQGQC